MSKAKDGDRALWDRYRRELCVAPSVGLRVDISRMDLDEEWLASMAPAVTRAHAEMAAVERGDLVNSDEERRVGHYWLRAPERAPEPELRRAIEDTVAAIKRFAAEVHVGRVRGERATFTELLVIGIGGSSLGPRFVASALGDVDDRLQPRFIDNTDPDGIDAVFSRLTIDRTLTIVISKSGGTRETRNGMLEAQARYRAAGLDFGRHAVAITGEGSQLARQAQAEGFLATFPMWDWVGGRTSELSAVGLLPAALQGLDVDALLAGARDCDVVTRQAHARALANPAMALALAWHHETGGRGAKDMVILPYKDRLALFSQYLQQLVMESLGKERDRDGRVVHQGITVYGNKGSTDQHAYVQQLRDGVANFFVTFIEVLRDRRVRDPGIEVEPGVTSGDFLQGFLLGTRRALYEEGRRSIMLTLDDVSPRSVGALIALYERAVGFYAALVNVNAYHQPGVEAGKKAAEAVIALQRRALELLRDRAGTALSVDEVATAVGAPGEAETLYQVLEHLAANARGVERLPGATPFDARYRIAAG
jgi:glucose-6-phosphate isomerase